jgi:hypothetical protein
MSRNPLVPSKPLGCTLQPRQFAAAAVHCSTQKQLILTHAKKPQSGFFQFIIFLRSYTICRQVRWGSNSLSDINYNGLSTHFRKNQLQIHLRDTIGSRSYTESYPDLYAKSHV